MTKARKQKVEEWQRFYKEIFGIDCDFSSVPIPVNRKRFKWILFADERLSTEMVYQICKEHSDCKRFGGGGGISSFEYAIKADRRSQSDGTYAVWLRGTKEADIQHRSKNIYDLEQEGVLGITLRERLLLELWYLWKFDKVLDLKCETLCSGTLGQNTKVPIVRSVVVHSPSIRLEIHFVIHRRDPAVRCREVIS